MSRHPFDVLVTSGKPYSLAEAALLFARDRYPRLDPSASVSRIEALASRADELGGPDPADQAAALRQTIAEEGGFGGDGGAYDDPRNSYLNEVLERRCGLPISLSALWIETAALIGWSVHGIGLPGHFLVGGFMAGDPMPRWIADPFNRGRALTPESAAAQSQSVSGLAVRLTPGTFAPATPHAILVRMLNNLRRVYLTRADWGAARNVLMRLRTLMPREAGVADDLQRVTAQVAKLN